jgi:hypothetical protein
MRRVFCACFFVIAGLRGHARHPGASHETNRRHRDLLARLVVRRHLRDQVWGREGSRDQRRVPTGQSLTSPGRRPHSFAAFRRSLRACVTLPFDDSRRSSWKGYRSGLV